MDKRVLLIDTAGIRKRGQIETGIEQYSVIRSMHAIDRCDVALLVLTRPKCTRRQGLPIFCPV